MTYTPTTDKVRVAYIVGNIYSAKDCGTPPQTPTQLKREFDRWLAEVKAQAWDEGYSVGSQDGSIVGVGRAHNPYTEEA